MLIRLCQPVDALEVAPITDGAIKGQNIKKSSKIESWSLNYYFFAQHLRDQSSHCCPIFDFFLYFVGRLKRVLRCCLDLIIVPLMFVRLWWSTRSFKHMNIIEKTWDDDDDEPKQRFEASNEQTSESDQTQETSLRKKMNNKIRIKYLNHVQTILNSFKVRK